MHDLSFIFGLLFMIPMKEWGEHRTELNLSQQRVILDVGEEDDRLKDFRIKILAKKNGREYFCYA